VLSTRAEHGESSPIGLPEHSNKNVSLQIDCGTQFLRSIHEK